MANRSDIFIRCWCSTYYNYSSGKWITGLLKISHEALLFQSNDLKIVGSEPNPLVLFIHLSQIKGICKAVSSFIYPAIKITTENKQEHWFSTFEDRNSTFLILQHCVQSKLFDKTDDSQTIVSTHSSDVSSASLKTNIGTKMLHSVHDSHATLQKAANKLVEQGEQIRNSAFTVQLIHEDLTVAERITKGLNSWFGRWRLPPVTKAEELIVVTDNDIPEVWDIDALCTQISGNKYDIQREGVFRLSKDGVTLLDMKQKIIHHFKWSDVSSIRVVSPWEILVVRFLIGQPDLSYGVISMHMPKVLIKLEKLSGNKMDYMNPPNSQYCENSEPVWTRPCNMASSSKKALLVPESKLASNSFVSDEHGVHSGQVEQKELISDIEVAEISDVLKSLKSMALQVQKEQCEQIETIDRLTESAVKADDRVKGINKTINKLLK